MSRPLASLQSEFVAENRPYLTRLALREILEAEATFYFPEEGSEQDAILARAAELLRRDPDRTPIDCLEEATGFVRDGGSA